METLLLKTKLYQPVPRTTLVPRPRLIEKLNKGLHGKLTLVSAAAGFGKTTLISEWIAGCSQPSAWLSLDERDNVLPNFLTYFVAALQTIAPTIGERVLMAIQSQQPLQIELLLTNLINEIAEVQNRFILVLDDFHAIDATQVDEALIFLLDNMPQQMHLVITTREDPHLPLSRIRARGQLTELRADDLRFTPAESALFLNEAMGLKLLPGDVAVLETRTEGWIAGLQLAAISMQGQKDTTKFIRSFAGSHRFVLDYLIAEVMEQQPPDIQTFLLQTSILNRLSGPLCEALTGQNNGQEILEMLDRSNLFIVTLDDDRSWFRYHHLFAEVLQARLMKEKSGQVPVLHQRASEWYEQQNDFPYAIHHALAAEDFPRAAGLIELVWPTMDQTFQSSIWLRWASEIPDEIVRTRPVLSVDYAWALLNDGNLDGAKSRLQDAERLLEMSAKQGDTAVISPETMFVVDEDQFRALPASIATAHTYASLALGDVANTVKFGRHALDLLPEDDYLRRGPAAALLGLAYWRNGDLAEAHQALADAMAGFQMSGNIIFAISGTYGLADIRITQGRLREATSTYERSLQLAMAQGEPVIPGTADLYLGLSKLYREKGEEETAKEHLRKSETLGEQAALADWPYRLRIAKARVKQTRGDLSGALELLDEAESLYFTTPVPNAHPVSALKTQVWIDQERLTESMEWARAGGLSVDGNLSYIREFEFITFAKLLVALYKREPDAETFDDAIKLTTRLLKAAEEGKRTGSIIEILLIQALAYEAKGDIYLALQPLERALTLAEPEGYARIFADEGLPMAQLLSEAAAREIMPVYVRRLLSIFESEKQTPALPPAQPLVDPLSKRELEILTLIAAGLKNKEIADDLFISLNTVLYHIKNIYSKIGVNKRTLAIIKAKELKII